MFLQISPVSAESSWRVRSARRAPPRCSRSGQRASIIDINQMDNVRSWHLRRGGTKRSARPNPLVGSSRPLDPRIGWIVVEHVVPPSALALADAPKILDQLDAVDPLGHLVAVLMLDSQAQRRAVVDGERYTVHFVCNDHLRCARRLEVNHLVVAAMAWVLPAFIERMEDEESRATLRPRLFKKRCHPNAGPGREVRKPLDADVQGRLRAARHCAQF